ncbi:unnamed protein product [Dicrocoelium dendriticum]|nr:unnamed protein product [Dicrocoelium dendriticum]
MLPEEEQPFVGKLYRRRWAMLFLFALSSACNAYHWIHLSIISDRVLFVWGASIPGATPSDRQLSVDWLSLIYLLTYLPLIVPAMWLLNRFGLRLSISLAVIIIAVGAWLKCLSGAFAVNPNTSGRLTLRDASAFPILMLAQTLEAIAQVFILGVPAQLASTWFGEKEVSTATSIGVLANQLGVALGFGIPPVIVPAASEDPAVASNEFTDIHQRMMYFLYGSAAFSTLPLIPVLIFFRSEPRIAPTYSQHKRRVIDIKSKTKFQSEDIDEHVSSQALGSHLLVDGIHANGKLASSINVDEDKPYPSTSSSSIGDTVLKTNELDQKPVMDDEHDTRSLSTSQTNLCADQMSFKEQLKNSLTNVNYVLLVISYGIDTGVYYALGTLLNVILQAYFVADAHIGWIGFTMVVSGILGSVVVGIILDKTKKFRHAKDIIIMCCGVSLFSLLHRFFWFLLLLIPCRFLHLLWVHILSPWIFDPNQGPQVNEKKQQKLERKMRRIGHLAHGSTAKSRG